MPAFSNTGHQQDTPNKSLRLKLAFSKAGKKSVQSRVLTIESESWNGGIIQH